MLPDVSSSDPFVVLTDGVVTLRCLDRPDAEAHLAGEDVDQVRWLSGGRSTLAGVERFIDDCREQWRTGGPRRHLGIRDAATDQLAGNVEAHLALPGLAPGEANLSYAVFPAWRGRGLAVRAVVLLCGWLASATPTRAAVIRVDVDNTFSHGVPLAAGFTRIGVLPDGCLSDPDGVPANSHAHAPVPMVRYERQL